MQRTMNLMFRGDDRGLVDVAKQAPFLETSAEMGLALGAGSNTPAPSKTFDLDFHRDTKATKYRRTLSSR